MPTRVDQRLVICLQLVCTHWVMVGTLPWFRWDQSRGWLLNSMAWWVLPRCQQSRPSHRGLWRLVRSKGQKVFSSSATEPLKSYIVAKEQRWLSFVQTIGLLGVDITVSARLSLQKGVVSVSVSRYNADILTLVHLSRSRVIYNESLLRLRIRNGTPAFRCIVIWFWKMKRNKMRKSVFTIAFKIAVICLGEKGFLVLLWLPFLYQGHDSVW